MNVFFEAAKLYLVQARTELSEEKKENLLVKASDRLSRCQDDICQIDFIEQVLLLCELLNEKELPYSKKLIENLIEENDPSSHQIEYFKKIIQKYYE